MNRKADLATTIITAIVGVVIAYFVCNIFIGTSEPVTVKTLDSSVSSSLAEPNPELFNYKALNPTVEVYVGECQEYDQDGNCADAIIVEQDEGVLEEIIENDSNSDELPRNQGQETE